MGGHHPTGRGARPHPGLRSGTAGGPADRPGERIDGALVRLGVVIVAGAFTSALDATVVFVALGSIGRDLAGPPAALPWAATGYLLALATVVPLTGWSVARFGARAMWLASLSLFIGGAALCGLAWSLESLIVFRVLQGLGAGMIPPLAQVILVRAAGPRRIGRVMSMVGVPTQLAPIAGPTLGGLLVEGLGWRAAFAAYVPLGAMALLLAWRGLPRDPRGPAPRLDLAGILLLSPGAAALLYGLSLSGGTGGRPAGTPVWAFTAVGVALLAGFVVHARRPGRAPAVDLRLFRHRPFTVASVLIFLSGASLFGLMFLLPAYYQQARGLDPLQAGLMLAPQGAGMVAALAIVGVLVDRFGPRAIVLTGIAITIAGTLPFTQAGIADDRPWSAAALVLRGLGLGAAAMPLTAAAYRELPKEEVPQAAGALVILQRLGASSGTALLAVALQRGLGRGDGAPAAEQAAAFSHAFWWTVALSVVALLPALALPGRPAGPGRAAPPAEAGPLPRPGRVRPGGRPGGPERREGERSVLFSSMGGMTPEKAVHRRADAARNDARILAAAREVFIEYGPDAPVSVIAERAGVGMGTLYRRYPSKEDLMRALTMATMEDTRRAAEEACAHPDPWAGFTGFLEACVEAGVDGSPRVTGSFTVTEEILQASRRAREAVQRLVDRAQAAGVLRADVNAHDIALVLGVLRELRVAHRDRDPALRRRFTAIVLDGLRPAAARPLPAPPAGWDDVVRAWQAVSARAGDGDPPPPGT